MWVTRGPRVSASSPGLQPSAEAGSRTWSRVDCFQEGGQFADVTAERIRGFLGANPFRPFVLHLPSGKTVEVPHRDFAAISPTGTILVVLGEEDSETIVDVALVERAEVPAGK